MPLRGSRSRCGRCLRTSAIAFAMLFALANAGPASADPILNPGNGHYYSVVDSSINWDNANTAAQASSFHGVAGHLVTITSSQENLFLTNTFGAGALQSHWTGGIIAFPVIDPPGGPPIGQPFGPNGAGAGVGMVPLPNMWFGSWVNAEPFVYSNFLPGTPSVSKAGADQRIILTGTPTTNGVAWDGIPASGALTAAGYVVEYDVVAAPEPATAALFGFGMLGLAGFRRMRRRV